MVVELLGTSRRTYTKRNGEPGVAHHLSVLTEAGEVGQLYVNEGVFVAAQRFQKGDAVLLEVEPSVYKGEVSLRVAGIAAAG